jgi:hypothetical protein
MKGTHYFRWEVVARVQKSYRVGFSDPAGSDFPQYGYRFLNCVLSYQHRRGEPQFSYSIFTLAGQGDVPILDRPYLHLRSAHHTGVIGHRLCLSEDKNGPCRGRTVRPRDPRRALRKMLMGILAFCHKRASGPGDRPSVVHSSAWGRSSVHRVNIRCGSIAASTTPRLMSFQRHEVTVGTQTSGIIPIPAPGAASLCLLRSARAGWRLRRWGTA